MSFARILLAAFVSGLAACAHTPQETAFYQPELRQVAPIRLVDANAPDGMDDHLVILVDPAGMEQIYRHAISDPRATHLYLEAIHGYRTPRANSGHPGNNPGGSGSSAAPVTGTVTSPGPSPSAGTDRSIRRLPTRSERGGTRTHR